MKPAPKIHLDPSSNSPTARMEPKKHDVMASLSEANGAAPVSPASVDAAIRNSPKVDPLPGATSKGAMPVQEATASTQPMAAHQTHGAALPRGPIMSVSQLISGRQVARGAVGSFDTLDQYKSFLNTLSLGELHRHAQEEAKIVPIDDRGRLIRRLETEYTSIASRTPSRKQPEMPKQKQYTQEQIDTLEAIKNKLLRR